MNEREFVLNAIINCCQSLESYDLMTASERAKVIYATVCEATDGGKYGEIDEVIKCLDEELDNDNINMTAYESLLYELEKLKRGSGK